MSAYIFYYVIITQKAKYLDEMALHSGITFMKETPYKQTKGRSVY